MRLIDTLASFAQRETETLREAVDPPWGGGGAGVDNTGAQADSQFRNLAQAKRDLGPTQHDKQRETALFLWDRNPIAKQIVNIQRNYIVGEGWSVAAKDAKVQAVLDAHWFDPINNWDGKIFDRVLMLSLMGEMCFSVAVQESNGLVRLGYVDPSAVKAVRPNPKNFEILDTIVLNSGKAGTTDKYLKAVTYDLKTGKMVGLRDGDTTPKGDPYESAGFFWAINKPAAATRGRSDLYSLVDYMDAWDQFLWNRVERSAFLNAWFTDVTIEGWDQKKIQAWLDTQEPPRPGTMRAHNDKVTYQTVQPEFQSHDAQGEEQIIRSPILVGAGLPQHWLYGVGDDANRASAYEMADPPIRMMRTRQLMFKRMLETILRYQIDEAERHGQLTGVPAGDLYEYEVICPEISKRDQGKIATTIRDLVGALQAAQAAGWISVDSARKLFLMVVDSFGMEFDANAEAEAIEKQIEAAKEEDSGGLILPGRDDDEPGTEERGAAD